MKDDPETRRRGDTERKTALRQKSPCPPSPRPRVPPFFILDPFLHGSGFGLFAGLVKGAIRRGRGVISGGRTCVLLSFFNIAKSLLTGCVRRRIVRGL
jgi:hypothetical protein